MLTARTAVVGLALILAHTVSAAAPTREDVERRWYALRYSPGFGLGEAFYYAESGAGLWAWDEATNTWSRVHPLAYGVRGNTLGGGRLPQRPIRSSSKEQRSSNLMHSRTASCGGIRPYRPRTKEDGRSGASTLEQRAQPKQRSTRALRVRVLPRRARVHVELRRDPVSRQRRAHTSERECVLVPPCRGRYRPPAQGPANGPTIDRTRRDTPSVLVDAWIHKPCDRNAAVRTGIPAARRLKRR